MKNLQKGFVVPLLLAIIAVLVVGGGVYLYSNNKKSEAPVLPTGTEGQTTNQVQQNNTYNPSINNQIVTNAGHIEAFEGAVNKSDFINASSYFANKVYVMLEGSSCCGEVATSRAKQELERIKGLVFTFNPTDAVVKEYLASVASDYPNRRLIKNSPKVYFDEFIIGVESDVSQQNKAVIGYKVSNDKITDLFINVGRDR